MIQSRPTRHPVTVSDERLAQRCARGRVVLIDDDTDILTALTALIELEGYACEAYTSAVDYLQAINYNQPCFKASHYTQVPASLNSLA
ncbi:MAG: hypothetical protein PHU77_06895 [Simplicispira sp.]|nr:hypothetical protein [Simplicispira sp.]